MDVTQLIQSASQLGLGGIAIFLWYMDREKIAGLADVVKEQIEEKRQMRDDRRELVKMVRECSQIIQRCATALEISRSREREDFGKKRFQE